MIDMQAKRPPSYSFILPDGRYIGREGHRGPWLPVGPGDARAYPPKEALSRMEFFRSLFGEDIRAIPAPRWNTQIKAYETPADVPPLN